MSVTYGRLHRKARLACLKRDNYTCRECGLPWYMLPRGKSSLTAQHIRPIRAGGTHDLGNLVTLCASCHGKADGGRRYRR